MYYALTEQRKIGLAVALAFEEFQLVHRTHLAADSIQIPAVIMTDPLPDLSCPCVIYVCYMFSLVNNRG